MRVVLTKTSKFVIYGVANVTSDINLAFWKRFKEHNITIPFPQRDVHLLNNPDAD
jgi:small-conductance mechanosensitive channel